MKYAERAKEIIQIEADGLAKVKGQLGDAFNDAVDMILGQLAQGGKVVVTGQGKNLPIGQKIAATLTSVGTPAVVLHPSEAMHGDLGILSENDLLIALSYSGETEEMMRLIAVVKRLNIKIVALTGEVDSQLAKVSHAVIPVQIDREACPFNMAPTTSTTAMLAVGDALAMVLLEARGFKKEDYANLHPGGSIGQTLLLRVKEIMRTGKQLAQVDENATVRDAVLAITSARCGMATMVDGNSRVIGVVTDGDLRRHMMDENNLIERPAKEIMTESPITVTEDQLAVDVLALFKNNKINDLPVVNRENKLVGMVDIQDLPKFKIL